MRGKRRFSLLIAVIMALTIFTIPVSASAAAAVPKVKKIKYEGAGKVDVDFYGRVSYHKNMYVVLADNKGKLYSAKILDRDSDEITFRINKYKTNRKYKFAIKGIKKRGTKKHGIRFGFVTIPAASRVTMQDVDYDPEDREVSFDFNGPVRYKNAKVRITDSKGRNYARYIIEKDSDDMDVKVNKLVYGKTYNYTISGVKKAGTKSFTTVKGKFRAIDD